MELKSNTVKSRYDYLITLEYLNNMLAINPMIGSQKVGVKYATFYNDKINEMLKDEYINLEILKELQLKVNDDLRFIRNDRKERMGMSDFTDLQTKKNDYMMSMILDFILTLPDANEIMELNSKS